jgi:hypothetical protein
VAQQKNTSTKGSALDRTLQKKMAPLHFEIFERQKLFAEKGFAKFVAKTLEDFYQYDDIDDMAMVLEERSRPPMAMPTSPQQRVRRGSQVEVSMERQKDLNKYRKVCDKKLMKRLAREKDHFGLALYNRLTRVVNDFDDWSNLQESLKEYEVDRCLQRKKLRPLLERNFNVTTFSDKHVIWMERHKQRLKVVKQNRDVIVERELEHLKQVSGI